LNLVVSPWGREAAQLLQLKYGTPWAEIPGLPVGPQGTERLLAALAKHLPLDSGLVHALRQRHNSVFERHLTRLAPIYFSAGFQREFSIVGELALVSGVTEFLAGTLGLIPKLAIVTDPLPEEEREDLSASLRQVLAPFQASLAFSEDAGEIADLLRASDSELVIGSSLERTLADELNTPFLAISFPLAGRLVLERGYVGCEGALALVEDLGTAILGQQQAKAIANGFS
jgi:nitrogenase molybdenum-iron protein beta chain